MTGSGHSSDCGEPGWARVKELLGRAGIDCREEPAMVRLAGGANNGVFRVDAGGEALVLKQYFSHPQDPRDRFGTETGFVDFLWRHGIRTVAELLATSESDRLALYRFVPGRRLEAAEVDESRVVEAAAFCRELFRLQQLPEARRFLPASEACFSMGEHIECVDRRLARLRSIPPESAVHRDVLGFVGDEVGPCWDAVCRTVRKAAAAMGETTARVLSPSDFGFHNAVLTASGRLCFFDFEYAGWDDPAKLVCDFFCQVEIPAPRRLMPRFIEAMECPGGGGALAERVECLFPVYVLKWCAIVLNEFVPIANARRRFSAAEPPSAERLKLQLEKARRMLRSVENCS